MAKTNKLLLIVFFMTSSLQGGDYRFLPNPSQSEESLFAAGLASKNLIPKPTIEEWEKIQHLSAEFEEKEIDGLECLKIPSKFGWTLKKNHSDPSGRTYVIFWNKNGEEIIIGGIFYGYKIQESYGCTWFRSDKLDGPDKKQGSPYPAESTESVTLEPKCLKKDRATKKLANKNLIITASSPSSTPPGSPCPSRSPLVRKLAAN